METKYQQILLANESKFIKQFKALSEDGRCLFLRMVLRRGVYFKKKTLVYKEILDLDAAIVELNRKKFAKQIKAKSKEELSDLMPLFIKKELIEFAERLDLNIPSKSAKKNELLALLIEAPKTKLLKAITEVFTVVKQEKIEEVERMLFLFFGNRYRNISEFVVRDLGYRNFREVQLDQLTPYFKTRLEIDQKWTVNLWGITVYEQLAAETPINEIFDELKLQVLSTTIDTYPAERSLSRLLIKVGRDLERSNHFEEALWAYEQTDYPPSNEREIRVLAKLGEAEKAIETCTRLQEATAHAEEYYFAKDFKARLLNKKNVKSTTQKQKEANSITIDVSFKNQVEMGTLSHYVSQGYNGMFSENLLWNSLFGMLFWDVIFADQQDAFHHPFQFSPSDWRTDHFYDKRKDIIDNQLLILKNRKKLKNHINIVFKEKYGLANPLIFWYEELLEHLEIFISYLSEFQLHKILLEMARNPKSNTKGFPDLFIWKGEDYQFVEVKSPNDKLSAQQLFWLDLFKSIDIKAEVLNVKFS